MNVAVIGGAGYIGSHQVKMLCDQNHQTIVIDNLSTGFETAIDKRAKFIQEDIRNYEQLIKIFQEYKIDAVMHFAAFSLVGDSVKDPLAYYNNNVYGMECLLKAMIISKVDKIIFSSTAATYGEHKVMPINEEYTTTPINPYGETKLAMEKMIKWVEQAHGIRSVALRYFNAAGADISGTIGECHNPETHLIPLILQVALGQRKVIDIYGDDYETPDGTCVRDYIHINDLAAAHLRALEHLNNQGASKIYNLGSGNGYSVKEIVETARKVTGHPIPAIVKERRAGDPDKLVASSQKIQKELNWKLEYDNIEYIIETAYKFHLNYPNGYTNK